MTQPPSYQPPQPRRSAPWWVLGAVAVVVVVVVTVVVTLGVTGWFSKARSSHTPAAAVTATAPKGPFRGSVASVLAGPADFSPVPEYSYEVVDMSLISSPSSATDMIDSCDRLMWPDKEYPGIAEGIATYAPSDPDSNLPSYNSTVYLRELGSWERDFDEILQGCPRFTVADGQSENVMTLAPFDAPDLDVEYHGYTLTTARIPESGGVQTTTERHYLVGVVRGVSFKVSGGIAPGADPTAVNRNIAALYNNQRRRILDAA